MTSIRSIKGAIGRFISYDRVKVFGPNVPPTAPKGLSGRIAYMLDGKDLTDSQTKLNQTPSLSQGAQITATPPEVTEYIRNGNGRNALARTIRSTLARSNGGTNLSQTVWNDIDDASKQFSQDGYDRLIGVYRGILSVGTYGALATAGAIALRHFMGIRADAYDRQTEAVRLSRLGFNGIVQKKVENFGLETP